MSLSNFGFFLPPVYHVFSLFFIVISESTFLFTLPTFSYFSFSVINHLLFHFLSIFFSLPSIRVILSFQCFFFAIFEREDCNKRCISPVCALILFLFLFFNILLLHFLSSHIKELITAFPRPIFLSFLFFRSFP